MSGELLHAALRYAEQDEWAVFPCAPDKAPRPELGKGGLHLATFSADQIREWWTRWPDASIGINCGASGLIVIDVDGPEGVKAFPALGLPDTLQVTTGRDGGGTHHYYYAPAGCALGSMKLMPEGELEVKAIGGYVIAPPSRHSTGRVYTSNGADVQTLDDDAVARLTAVKLNPKGAAPPVGDVIPQGQRDDTLASLAGTMQHRGMGEAAILAALKVTNKERCKPPLPVADLERIARSIGSKPAGEKEKRLHRVELRPASGYGRIKVRWLTGWDGLVPLAMLSILVGMQGDGKTMLTCKMTADETRHGRRVVIATTEDEIDSVLRPRLEAAGANLDLVSFTVLKNPDGDDGALLLPDHGGILVDAIEREQPSLFILDPMEAFLGVSIDSWKSPDIRRALAPISIAAERTGCAAIVVGYINRGASTAFLSRIAESMAFSRAARSALLLWPDPEDPEGDQGCQRILALGKTNLAPRRTLSRCYRIDTVVLPADGELEEVVTAKMVYTGDSRLSANQLLSQSKKAERDRTLELEPSPQVREAMELLRQDEVLGSGEWAEAKHVLADGAANGFSGDVIRAAAKQLGVTKEKDGFKGPWRWRLARAGDIEAANLLQSSTTFDNQAGSHEDGRTSAKIGTKKDDLELLLARDPGTQVELDDWLAHVDEPEEASA
jgi:hypothetical protein